MKNFKRQLGYTIAEVGIIAWAILLLVLGVGWVMNIVTIIGMLSDPITGMFIFRCVGIFVMPLGGVLGYF